MPPRKRQPVPGTPTMQVQNVRLDTLLTDPANARMHDRRNIDAIAASLRRFGQQRPFVVDDTRVIVVGNGMYAAMLQEGWEWGDVIFFPGDAAEARAFAIADNRTAELARWDDDVLAQTLQLMDGPLLATTGFTELDLAAMLGLPLGLGGKRGIEPDDLPDQPTRVRSKLGSVWQLGEHRIMCGDSTNPAHIKTLCGDLVPTLIHADPPYGMGKEASGVLNDNLHRSELDEFQVAWWTAWTTVLDDSASVYIWGQPADLWRLWWHHLADAGDLVFRNELVWFKQAGIGQTTPRHNYPTATERCLFLMRGQQFLGSQNKEDYWWGYEPLREWLANEVALAGWTAKDVNRLTQSQMAGHWLTQSQFTPIPERHYKTLQTAAKGAAFTTDYAALFTELFPDLRAGGNAHRRDLAEQMRESRTFHDNEWDNMNDVWQFPRVSGEDRFGHATPKPVALMERVIRTSTRPQAVVAVPFAGTGPELIAAQNLGRIVVAMELSPEYVDLVCRRFQAYTGVQPINCSTGKSVNFEAK